MPTLVGVPTGVPLSTHGAPGTEMVGRETDYAHLISVLARHRFVALVGRGGVDKTRLALEVVHALGLLRRYMDLSGGR